MRFCDYICGTENEKLFKVFSNLKTEIELLNQLIDMW